MPAPVSNFSHSPAPTPHSTTDKPIDNKLENSPTFTKSSTEAIFTQLETSNGELKHKGIKRSSAERISSEPPKLSNSKLKVSKIFHQQCSPPLSKHPCYRRNLTREMAEEELKPLAIGTWLIRYSANQNKYVVSQKIDAHTVSHRIIKQSGFEDLEKHFGQFSQIHLFKTIQLHHKEKLLVKPQKKQTSLSNYDYQLQLNLGRGVTASMLETKAHSHQLKAETIHLNSTSEESEAFTEKISQLTHHSRLYLIGHAAPGVSELTSEEKADGTSDYALTISHFVNLLKTKAPHLQKQEDGQLLKISLVACYTGIEGLLGEESFALQLSRALDQAGIPAEILARTGSIHGEPDLLQKQVEERHHSTGDKISVTTTNGQTIIRIVQYEDMIELKSEHI